MLRDFNIDGCRLRARFAETTFLGLAVNKRARKCLNSQCFTLTQSTPASRRHNEVLARTLPDPVVTSKNSTNS